MRPTRRQFLISAAALPFAGLAAAAQGNPPMLRVITYNILACAAFPERRDNRERLRRFRRQVAERIALELALYAPDIVTFQESPAESVVAEIAEKLDMAHAYFPGGFPGAVLSRHPIVDSNNCPMPGGQPRPEDCFTRHWGSAVIETPQGKLLLHSAHLHPQDHAVRMREAAYMIEAMGTAIAGEAPMLLMGDLNHPPETPEYGLWTAAGLEDSFLSAGTGSRASYSSVRPREAIDYIWAGGALRGKAVSCRVLHEGAFRNNPEDPGSLALSDHLPVMAEFSFS